MINEDVPYGAITPAQGNSSIIQQQSRADLVDVETTRAQAETQAGFLMAKQFPRIEGQAIERIVRSCQRKALAEQAVYAFPRGGQQVTGPSIRLAEVLAQQWGNINFGYRELAEAAGVTQVLAYCYDLETNTRSEKIFHVKHTIDTKNGPKVLTSRRDIYEQIANQASRRIRSCILQIIPGDVCETAMEACAVALEDDEATDLPARQKAAIKHFEQFGVTQKMIETRFQKKATALLPADLVVLRRIYQGLHDGMSSVSQWFETETATEKAKAAVKKATGEPKKKKTTKKKAEKAPEPEPEPETTDGAPEPPEGDPGPEPPPWEAEEDEPEPEPGPDPEPEPEDEPEVDMDDVLQAVTVNTKPGRPSNLSTQLEKHMIRGISGLMNSGVEEEDAGNSAALAIYKIVTSKKYGVENVNDLALDDRAGFLGEVSDWADSVNE